MRDFYKKVFKVLSVTALVLVSVMTASVLDSKPAYAARCDTTTADGALSYTIFVPWYKYLDCDADGSLSTQNDEWSKTVPLVGMAVIELLTRLAGLIAVGFIIWGGIQYIISQGEPSGISGAKSTILNAVVGLVIALTAIGLTQFVAGLIK